MAVRFSLIPLLGNRFGFDLFLISTFLCGRYLGFGPAVFALLGGAVPVTIVHFLGPNLHDPYFPVGLAVYLLLGAIVILLCKTEQDARQALQNEIRERRTIEAALRDSQKQLLLAIAAGKLGAWQLDVQTQRVQWSPLMEAMHGYAPGAFGGTLTEAIAHNHPEDQERILQLIEQAPDAVRLAYRVISPSGQCRWIEAVGEAVRDDSGTTTQIVGVCSDVTEQKEAEIALRQAEEKFRSVAVHAPVGIFETDIQGRCRFVNDAWCEIAGATIADALGDGWQRFLHPEDRQRVIDEWYDATSGRPNHATEFRFLNPTSGPRSVIASATAVLDPAGMVSGYVGTIVDVTERKAAEDALRASEAKLREQEDRIRLAVESAEIGTFDFDPLTNERTWSDRTKVIFGLSPEADVRQLSFRELLHPDDQKRATQAIHKAMDPEGDGAYEVDYRVIRPDGAMRWVAAKGQAFFEGEAPKRRAVRFIGTVLDRTEEKQAESALRQALDEIQADQEVLRNTIEFQDKELQLIAYDIHDGVVQYATGALMHVEALRNRTKATDVVDQLETIEAILRRTVAEGRRLIHGIRTPVLDDWGVVPAIEQLIEHESWTDTQVHFVKDDSLGRMPPQIEETIYRITQEALTNVRKHSKSTEVRVELCRNGDRVLLKIHDWGVGFLPSNTSMRGHGLRGMAQRARIAGGELKIKSSPMEGTQIALDLPLSARIDRTADIAVAEEWMTGRHAQL